MDSEFNIHTNFLTLYGQVLAVETLEINTEGGFDKVLTNLENLINQIKKQDLFSPNEEFDQILPQNIKFMLLPYFHALVRGKKMDNRYQSLKNSRMMYLEFLKLMRHYRKLNQVQEELVVAWSKGEKPKELTQGDRRAQLIEDAKELKKIKAAIEVMKKEKENYEERKEFYEEVLKEAVYTSFKEIKLIDQEMEMVDMMGKIKSGQIEDFKDDRAPPPKPLQIMHIPKMPEVGMAQSQSAAPSVVATFQGDASVEARVNARQKLQQELTKPFNPPTMSLEEFADKEIQRAQYRALKEEEAKMNKPGSDSEDEETADRKTKEAREWDDWKDAHPKGSGNTKRI